MALPFSKLNERILATAIRKSLPVVAGFELTARCNLRCQMCYVCANNEETRSRELSTAEWIDLARQAQKSGVLFMLLTGGEPLVRADFWEIYEAIFKMGFKITLNTNGTTITPEVAERLRKFPPSRITVSIYGSSPEVYQRVTGSAAGYEKMRRGIELLLPGPWDLKLRTTLTRQLKDDLANIVHLIMGYEKVVGVTDYIAPCRDITGMDPMGSRLSAEETQEAREILGKAAEDFLRKKLEEVTKQAEQAGSGAQDAPAAREETRRVEGEKAAAADEKAGDDPYDLAEADLADLVNPDHAFTCGAGHYSYWITWQGEMTPCALMPEPAASVREMSLADAWQKIVRECAMVPVCGDCAACDMKKFCLSCPARLRMETGAFASKAEYLCERARSNMQWVEKTRAQNATG